jgi:hypothetical protein
LNEVVFYERHNCCHMTIGDGSCHQIRNLWRTAAY